MSRTAAVTVVALHLAVAFVHGAAHAGAGIALSPLQNAFVWVVIMAGPLVALWMILSRRRFGAELLALTMAASLVFGIVNHFVIDSQDHVSHITSDTWRLPFQVTAALLMLLEAAGVLIGTIAASRRISE